MDESTSHMPNESQIQPTCNSLECTVPEHGKGSGNEATQYGPGRTKWSCHSFLEELRGESDDLANEIFARLEKEGLLEHLDFRGLFKEVASNEEDLPAAFLPRDEVAVVPVPQALADFFAKSDEQARVILEPVLERIDRGQRVFGEHVISALFVLLARSLPEGYAGPNFAEILDFTDQLEDFTYIRLIRTLQALYDVSRVHGFESRRLGLLHDESHEFEGRAISTAKQLRLMHAGIRHIVRKQARSNVSRHIEVRERPLENYQARFGDPLNLEDMLGVIMAFSFVVVDGLRSLNLGLTDQEEEDFFFVWQMFARLMGIHPKGEPTSTEYVPTSLSEATEFYEAHTHRHYVGAGTRQPGVVNKSGRRLACFHMLMMRRRAVPWWLPFKRVIVRSYLQHFMGVNGCLRLGIRPVRGQPFFSWLLRLGPKLLRLVPTSLRGPVSARVLFPQLIRSALGVEEVSFRIPDDLEDLEEDRALGRARRERGSGECL